MYIYADKMYIIMYIIYIYIYTYEVFDTSLSTESCSHHIHPRRLPGDDTRMP